LSEFFHFHWIQSFIIVASRRGRQEKGRREGKGREKAIRTDRAEERVKGQEWKRGGEIRQGTEPTLLDSSQNTI